MNVSLSTALVEYVEAEVASGAYATASEVVRDALRLLRRERAAYDARIGATRSQSARPGGEMDNQVVISAVADEVRARLTGEGSGHDWWHVYRVWRMAERLARYTNADTLVVQLAALLHDIADWKFHGGDETIGPRLARCILEKHGIADDTVDAVCRIIPEISFKGAGVASVPSTLEGKIVQDADRLDAIGAIGIARAFAYGGHAGSPMHEPGVAPVMHASKEAYISSRGTTINHFYEKLLLLSARMNTEEAREIARDRHEFMRIFLDRFHAEWG